MPRGLRPVAFAFAAFRAFEIVVDFTAPAAPASWGRIKALYR